VLLNDRVSVAEAHARSCSSQKCGCRECGCGVAQLLSVHVVGEELGAPTVLFHALQAEKLRQLCLWHVELGKEALQAMARLSGLKQVTTNDVHFAAGVTQQRLLACVRAWPRLDSVRAFCGKGRSTAESRLIARWYRLLVGTAKDVSVGLPSVDSKVKPVGACFVICDRCS